MSTGGASAHLARLLALVPYLLNRQGIPIEQAAKDAGITVEQLDKDLWTLFMCGLPGGMPDDLIDADWEDGLVYLSNADTIARPLRLAPEEVATLLVGLRLLAQLPGSHDREALDKATAKLQEVAGAAAGMADARVGVGGGTAPDSTVLDGARRALTERRRLHLRYYVPGRDETTERDVEPMRLALVDGHTYLEGWCHRAEEVRLFRLDRVLALEVLDIASAVPADAVAHNLDEGLFSPSAADTVAGLELERAAHWVTEYYPCEEVAELEGGRLYVRLRSGDPEWMVRLALRLGPTARLVEPPELAEQVRAAAAAALAGYPEVV
ncbi:YafY family protein [Sporichthya sp.]|uniref:helix-turn-helix transcriptional regulator n=1 Tax=Sporichthya sp. TaxID=65475 RepID=UPI0025F8DA2D|nr:WYL domain-containing protein [Sporichthya sp.]